MPRVSAIGTANSAVTAASSSELGSRLAISVGHRHLRGDRLAQVAAQHAGQPTQVALVGRHVQAHLGSRNAARASGVASWPSCSCAASPGSTPVMANTTADTASSDSSASPMRWASSLSRMHVHRSCGAASGVQPDVLGERGSPSARPGDGRQALELGEWPSRLARNSGMPMPPRCGSWSACRHTSACAWPGRSRRGRPPAAGRTARSSSAIRSRPHRT